MCWESEWGSGGEGIRRGLPFTAKYGAADDDGDDGDGENKGEWNCKQLDQPEQE